MFLSFLRCHFTYFRIFSSSRPTVLTQYPFAQKCRPQYRFFRSRCLSNIFMAHFPFRNPTTSDTEYLGGMERTRWTWSSCTFISKISSFFHPQSCVMNSITDSRTGPFKILNLYLGQKAMWYLHCQTACAIFLNSLIEYLLFVSRVTTRDNKEVFIFGHHYATCLAQLGLTSIAGGLSFDN